MKHRIAIATAVALFLVLAGTGGAHALWASQASSTATVSSGTHSFALSGGFTTTVNPNLNHPYTATTLVDAAAVRVQNTGSVTAPYSVAITATGTLAGDVDVTTWPMTATSCTSATAPATNALTSSWNNVAALTSTLAGGASQYYCIRTAITAAEQTSLATRSVTASASLTSALGTNWTAIAPTQTITQTVSDTAAPSIPAAPTATNTSGYSTQLSWAASTDNVGVAAYLVFRNGVQIATVSGLTYTDATLTNNTTYSYTIRARDAVPNTSGESPALNVTTLAVVPTTWYRVIGSGSGRCIDANGAGTADGTQLIIWDCHGNSNQRWRFTPTSDGYYAVAAQNVTTSVWSLATTATTDGIRAQLWTNIGGTNQEWRITQPSAGVYKFIAKSSGKCLDVQNNVATAGTPLQQATCNTTTAQSFTLANN